VEATGGIHNQLVDVVRFGGGDCVIKHRSRVAAMAGLDHFDAGAGSPDFKLLDGRGAEGVGAQRRTVRFCARCQAASLPADVVLPCR